MRCCYRRSSRRATHFRECEPYCSGGHPLGGAFGGNHDLRKEGVFHLLNMKTAFFEKPIRPIEPVFEIVEIIGLVKALRKRFQQAIIAWLVAPLQRIHKDEQ